MDVTDPTIDPITGLPVLNPQDVIQQIPLGVQTFPYEDMQATARPTRNPMYGDDILPVSAFVAGQHPSTGSAQTVETDAAHAMKVFVVNQSSGGGGGGGCPVSLSITPISNPAGGNIASGDRQPVTWGFGTILMDIGGWVTAGTDPGGPNIVCPLARTYVCAVTIDVNAGSGVAFDAGLWIDVNGVDAHTIAFAMNLDPATGQGSATVTLPLNLKLGDIIQVLVENDSTQPVGVTNGSIAIWGQ